MHTMNYATSAPAATAGGQQNGPVRYFPRVVFVATRLFERVAKPFSYPYLSNR
jgi:hypothetical protein